MRIFEPHIHMTSRTTDDYQAMYESGVRALVEPSLWMGQPRTRVDSFADYFDSLVGWEPFRAAQYGIAHHATIALNPKEANDPRLEPVLDMLPRYLAKDGVVAVGEIGFDSMSDAEERIFIKQLEMAGEFDLPVMVHTPHRDKAAGTVRTLELIKQVGIEPGKVVVDHLNETTVEIVKDTGAWMGFSVYPTTKMDESRMVAIMEKHGLERVMVNSAADWGQSDPLKTAKTGAAMKEAGFSAEDIDLVLWQNPHDFYAQSGRLMLEERLEAAGEFEGNTVLRG